MEHCDAPAVPAYTYKEEPHITLVVVEAGPDAADDWIAARAGTGDVVITADVPLADRALKTGAQALHPAGRPFTSANIGSALASRSIGEHLRAMGEVTRGPKAFTAADRSRFLQALDAAVMRARRGQPPRLRARGRSHLRSSSAGATA